MVHQPSPRPDRQEEQAGDPTGVYPRGYPYGAPLAYEGRVPLAASAASAVTFLAGVWLVLAPFVLDYAPAGSGIGAYWNDLVVGVAIAMLAIVRAVAPSNVPWFSIVNVVLGAWLIVAPFVLEYDTRANDGVAIGNDLAVGLVVIVMAATSAASTFRHRRSEQSSH